MAADGRRHVLAIGGGMLMPRDSAPLQVKYAMELTGRPRPKLCVLNTAVGDDPNAYLRVYDRLAETQARVRHLALFPMPNVADPEDLLMSQDVIFVGGGSVANMVAVWRVHRIDEILRKAWQAGIVLAGSSAGGICWFEGGTTDSFGIRLRAFTDGLAMLPGIPLRGGAAAAVPAARRGRRAARRNRLRRWHRGALHRRDARGTGLRPAGGERLPGHGKRRGRRHGNPAPGALPRRIAGPPRGRGVDGTSTAFTCGVSPGAATSPGRRRRPAGAATTR